MLLTSVLRDLYIKNKLHVKTISKNAFKIKQWLNVLLTALFDNIMLADNYAKHYSISKNYDMCDMHDR